MEFKTVINKLQEMFRKYRYGLIVIVIGIILLLIPTKKEEPIIETEPESTVGTVSVESEIENGSTFTVTVTLKASMHSAHEEQEKPLTAGLSALVVDDDEVAREHAQLTRLVVKTYDLAKSIGSYEILITFNSPDKAGNVQIAAND